MIHDPQLEVSPDFAVESPRGTILIVDDDRDQVFVLRTRLERLGFMVVGAHHGKEALAIVNEQRPDLVLLDLNLPDLSGFDVCREIADSPDTCGLPVIILSGKDGDEIVRECRAVGSEFFVRKPYDPNVLLALIEQSIGW